MPRYPTSPGATMEDTSPSYIIFSGVTIINLKFFATSRPDLYPSLQFICLLIDLFYCADHIECLLWYIIHLAVNNHLKAFYCILQFYIFARRSCECLSYEE